jgi:hypothetical protein
MRVAEILTTTALAMALLIPIARARTPLALAVSDGRMRRLEQEFRDDLYALDAFAPDAQLRTALIDYLNTLH